MARKSSKLRKKHQGNTGSGAHIGELGEAPNAREMAENEPRRVPSGNAANSGELIRHPKGSNGGVHRGADRFPRANVMPAIALMTMAALGLAVKDLPATYEEWKKIRRRTHRNLIPTAAAHLIVRGNMNIITEAAMGEREVYAHFIRLQLGLHQILAGGNGKNGHGNGHRQPFASSFVPENPAPATRAPAREPADDAPLIVDGQEYVAGRV